MIVRYNFVDSTHSEINVETKWAELLRDFDRLEANADRRQRYHCFSMDAMLYFGMDFAYYDDEIEYFINNEQNISDEEKLVKIINTLKPKHKEIIVETYYHRLTLK